MRIIIGVIWICWIALFIVGPATEASAAGKDTIQKAVATAKLSDEVKQKVDVVKHKDTVVPCRHDGPIQVINCIPALKKESIPAVPSVVKEVPRIWRN